MKKQKKNSELDEKKKFEHTMTALFRVPKAVVAGKIKAKNKKGKT